MPCRPSRLRVGVDNWFKVLKPKCGHLVTALIGPVGVINQTVQPKGAERCMGGSLCGCHASLKPRLRETRFHSFQCSSVQRAERWLGLSGVVAVEGFVDASVQGNLWAARTPARRSQKATVVDSELCCPPLELYWAVMRECLLSWPWSAHVECTNSHAPAATPRRTRRLLCVAGGIYCDASRAASLGLPRPSSPVVQHASRRDGLIRPA